jgi:hypothetical protein
MNDFQPKNYNRRKFLTGIIPASCCLVSLNSIVGAYPSCYSYDNKFDKFSEQKMTYRDLFSLQFGDLIELMKGFSKEVGTDRTIDIIKKIGEEQGVQGAQDNLKKSDNNSFNSFIKCSVAIPYFDNTLSFEYIEKSDKVCEIRVAKCLWAEVFRKEKAEGIGYAYICHGDFTYCKSFNPKIKLIRDKTLMQGYECCNHKWILET